MHCCYCILLLHTFFALLYFYNVSSYSAIQPQVCNKLSVQCSVYVTMKVKVAHHMCLPIRVCKGELCVRHVETLLISRRVNA